VRNRIKTILREYYGDFTTNVESLYVDTITENLLINDYQHRLAWATYNQVILELKLNPKNKLKLQELQYKLCDNEDPNKICIEIIQEVDEVSEELEILYYKINNFIFYEIGERYFAPQLLYVPTQKELSISIFKERYGAQPFPKYLWKSYLNKDLAHNTLMPNLNSLLEEHNKEQ